MNTNAPRIDAQEILDGILRWVEIESPSHDAAAVNKMVTHTQTELARLGAKIQRIDGRDGYGDALRAHAPWNDGSKGILVLAHLDTVHPIGMKDTALKIRREGDKVYGPGIYDMKAGGYLALYAFQHLIRQGKRAKLPVTFFFVPEEEVGSPTTRALIEAEALKNKYVLVAEPAREGGKIVTARKGVGRFEIKIKGKPAHAGARHEDGRSAVKELAHQIIAIEAMTDYARGVTTNVGLIHGGTGVNVVPQFASCEIDLRVPSQALAEEMTAKILALKPATRDVEMTVTGGMNRPPYGKDAGIAKLFDHAKALAAEIGFELKDVPLTGGGSDGNFTAALGIPTLDGLGADGYGAHADYEHIFYSSLDERAKLWVRLFETLE